MAFHSFGERRVWFFDQATAMRAVNNKCDAKAHGSCHNFSLEWVTVVYGQRDSKTSITGSQGARETHMKKQLTVKSAIVTQTAFGVAWGQTNYAEADQMMAKLRQLEVTVVIPFKPLVQAEVSKQVKGDGRTGYVYTFWFQGGGGHSIAVYRSGSPGLFGGGHVFVFDPNLGEFRMAPGDFAGWIRSFLAHYTKYFGPVVTHAMKSAERKAYNLRGAK